MQTAEQIVKSRGEVYGDFYMDASICQSLKEIAHATQGWGKLAPDQKQAIEMVFVKIARILNGNPDFPDHWADMEGYPLLVRKRLLADAEPKSGGVRGLLEQLPIFVEKSRQSSEE